MPQPTSNQLHVDRYLTDVAIAWSQDQDNFVADKVFPVVPVTNESNLFATYSKGFFYRSGQMQPRPLGGRPPQAGYEVGQGTYRAIEWGLEHHVDDRVRVNADAPLDPDMSAARFLMAQSMIQRDTLWTSSYFATGIWGSDWTGVASAPTGNEFVQWDQSGGDPITFLRGRLNEVGGATGYRPNTLVLGSLAYEGFINNSTALDRIRYTQRGVMTTELVAALLDIEKVVVARGVSNTAHEGQTDNIAYIADQRSALLAYAAPAPSITEPSAGYTFAYTGLIPGYSNAYGGVIERGRDEMSHTDIFQIRAAYDQKMVASDLGLFMTDVVSANYTG